MPGSPREGPISSPKRCSLIWSYSNLCLCVFLWPSLLLNLYYYWYK